jgi:polyhydroxybutyrate depolymerase
VPETVERWVERNGCESGPEITYENGAAICETWSDCDEDTPVSLCRIDGVEHCWPGRSLCPWGPSTRDIDASREMVRFFETVERR